MMLAGRDLRAEWLAQHMPVLSACSPHIEFFFNDGQVSQVGQLDNDNDKRGHGFVAAYMEHIARLCVEHIARLCMEDIVRLCMEHIARLGIDGRPGQGHSHCKH